MATKNVSHLKICFVKMPRPENYSGKHDGNLGS